MTDKKISDLPIAGSLAPATDYLPLMGVDGIMKRTPISTAVLSALTALGSGTVSSVSVTSANGFGGSVATASTTPAITITTSVNGLLKGNGTAVSAAVANTDFIPGVTPGTSGNVLTSNGSSWISQALSQAGLTRSARTSNTILGVADKGTFIDITSGTFTQTFTAAATLGAGWWCYLRNSGTGDITLDPNASETIDGLTSYIMYPQEVRLIHCDGSVFNSIILHAFSRTFTASGTFTKPPGYNKLGGIAWAGGNSGQRNNNAAALSVGGSGGGCFPFTLEASAVGATETVTIGAGGLSVTTVANGNIGGSTSFGSWLTVWVGSTWTNGSAVGANAYTKSGTILVNSIGFEAPSAAGNTGLDTIFGGATPSTNASTTGGCSMYGGGSGGSVSASAVVAAPGTSKFGGNGGAASSAGNGTDGTAPGGGGGATQTGTQSGAGARGELRIWGML